MIALARLPVDSFDWSGWRAGADIWIKLGFHPRWFSIIENETILRKYAVGYIPGNRLFCRPEPDEIAVMFLIDDLFGWTHLRKEEFERVFDVR